MACTLEAVCTVSHPTKVRSFPEGFQFGVATAAYQVEGGWNEGGRTESMWDTFCHQDPTPIIDGTSGDVACNSYHFYKRDIKMIKDLGVDFYRFSISWTRILPTGFANIVNEDGTEYYNKLIDELLANGIEPVVTIFHWDLPQKLQDLGGWCNPLIAEWFEDYARVLFNLFGDRVKTWVTLNEPKQIGLFGYGLPLFPPAINAHGIGEYLCAKNMVMANARAWHLYDNEFRASQKGTCGITIAADYRIGATEDPDDVEAGLNAMEFELGLYAHPIFSSMGGFPERVISTIARKSAEQGYPRSRLPQMSPEEVEFVKGTSDFFGFNHYSTKFLKGNVFPTGYPIPSSNDDIGGIAVDFDDVYGFERGSMPHLKTIPGGIRASLVFVKKSYNNPPIMILENGFGTHEGYDDQIRISYYRKYLNSVLDAIELDGCNVIGYTAWSLMDNFEWKSGLSIKFGLYEVDHQSENKTRRPRKSAQVYRHVTTTKTLDPSFEPDVKCDLEY